MAGQPVHCTLCKCTAPGGLRVPSGRRGSTFLTRVSRSCVANHRLVPRAGKVRRGKPAGSFYLRRKRSGKLPHASLCHAALTDHSWHTGRPQEGDLVQPNLQGRNGLILSQMYNLFVPSPFLPQPQTVSSTSAQPTTKWESRVKYILLLSLLE